MFLNQVLARTCSRISDHMKEYWRVHCHKNFGGVTWLIVLLAFGDVEDRAVELANEFISGVIVSQASREPTQERLPGARISEREKARRQGMPLPPVEGPKHVESDPKLARKKAKELERQKGSPLYAQIAGCSIVAQPLPPRRVL